MFEYKEIAFVEYGTFHTHTREYSDGALMQLKCDDQQCVREYRARMAVAYDEKLASA